MRFLVAFVAVLGYASASYIAPFGYAGHGIHGAIGLHGVNVGDAQAAAIDSTVVATDHARAWHDRRAGAAEIQHQHITEAARQHAETSRDIHENAYWNGVSANQEAVAAAQSHAAAVSGAIAGQAGYGGYAGYGAGHVAAPLAVAGYGLAGAYGHGLAAPYGAHGLGLRAWY